MAAASPALEWSDLGRYKAGGRFLDGYPSDVRRFFAPDDQVHDVMVAVVQSARVSIAAAMYGYDDEELDALFRAAWETERLPVLLCLDKSQAGGAHEREIVARWPTDQIGNRLLIGQSRMHAINHLKLIVVDGIYTVGGSTNLSLAGEQRQNNECIVIRDAVYAAESRAKIDLTADEMRKQMSATRRPST